MAMAVASMRGLHVFISDIRNCQNKEAERARVDKELANIRTHFKTDRVSPWPQRSAEWAPAVPGRCRTHGSGLAVGEAGAVRTSRRFGRRFSAVIKISQAASPAAVAGGDSELLQPIPALNSFPGPSVCFLPRP